MPIDRIKLPDNTVQELRDSTKQEILVSGENIKTINGESILGSGNITIEGGGGGDMSAYEVKANKVSTISASSTNEQYPSAKAVYDAIMAGGTVEEDIPDVIFIDYDGTITNSYSRDDFAFLTEMPANPTHEGLTSQGWNWTLADAKDYVSKYGRLVIGQMYVTSDGKTYFGIRIDDTTLDFFSFKTTGSGSVVIDWGDGTVETTTPNTHTHTYASNGEYVISFSKENSVGLDWVGGGYIQTQLHNAPLIWARLGDISGQLTGGGFGHCFNLETITLPSGITGFGNNWFRGCESLNACVVPDTVSMAGTNMCDSCYEMRYISLSKTTPVSTSYFNSCRELLEVNIPQVVTNIGNYTFYHCYRLLYATIPDGLTNMGNNVFSFCLSLRELMLPDTLTSIGSSSFDTCFSLKRISIPCNVPQDAFSSNISLESAEISGNIGIRCFNNCTNLKSVKFNNGCETIGANAFQSCQSLKEVVLPEGCVSINSQSAFVYLKQLERVYLPSTIQTLPNDAFRGCSTLREVAIDKTASYTIGTYAFSDCKLLEYFDASGATSIGSNAFYQCDKLRQVNLSDTLTAISQLCFGRCYDLESIDIPASVTSIGSSAFSECYLMRDLYVHAATPPSAGGNFLYQCFNGLTIHVPAGTLSAYQSATNWSAHASKMVEMDE